MLPQIAKSEDVERKTIEIRSRFKSASPEMLEALMPLMRRAAIEELYLDSLDGIAAVSGLVVVNADTPKQQRALPVSAEITRHQASLTAITDKLLKYLGGDQEAEDDGLDEYE